MAWKQYHSKQPPLTPSPFSQNFQTNREIGVPGSSMRIYCDFFFFFPCHQSLRVNQGHIKPNTNKRVKIHCYFKMWQSWSFPRREQGELIRKWTWTAEEESNLHLTDEGARAPRTLLCVSQKHRPCLHVVSATTAEPDAMSLDTHGARCCPPPPFFALLKETALVKSVISSVYRLMSSFQPFPCDQGNSHIF